MKHSAPPSQLIASLQQRSCYPHPVQRIEVRETHISWVILTGEFAYKIKKPVRLSFLDFSTLELRKRYCDEELRLNRRFAPALYLEVVAITGSPSTPQIDGDGPAIEYAVKLRQFDPEQELSALLNHAAVDGHELAVFGARLAQIHASSPAYPAAGAAAHAWRLVYTNFQEFQAQASSQDDESNLLVRWLATEHARIAPVLEARGLAARVRECHGDLHAGNVVRLEGALAAFDCLEFAAELRRLDVADDLSFLVMDLTVRGHATLAYAFLSGWLEENGDYAAVELLAFFCVHRALVRAKVAMLSGDDHAARSYRTFARAALEPQRPQLIVMCGLSGSGKTWLSTRLIEALRAVRIRSDVERKRLAGLRAHESSAAASNGGIYTQAFNDRVYERMLEAAAMILRAGEHAIIDAAFLKRSERRRFIALAAQLQIPVTIVHCMAPEAELRSRLIQREASGNDASEAGVELLSNQVGYWESFADDECEVVLEVRTDQAASVAAAVAVLARH
jgi:uncharacterized protein